MSIEITHSVESRINGKETIVYRAIEILESSGQDGRRKDLGQIGSIGKSSIDGTELSELTDRLLFWGQAAFRIHTLSSWQKVHQSLFNQLLDHQVPFPNQKTLDRFRALSGSQIPWRDALVQRLENIQSDYKLR